VSSSRLDLIILDTVLIHFFVLPSFPRRIPMVTGQCEDEGTLFSLTNANITTNSQAMTYMRENYVPLGNAEELAELFQLYPRDPTIGSPYNTTVLNQLTPQFKRRKLP
jgi:acetylcholinesterase